MDDEPCFLFSIIPLLTSITTATYPAPSAIFATLPNFDAANAASPFMCSTADCFSPVLQ
jgi:hypothetical protein